MAEQVARDFAQKFLHFRALLCAAREEYSNIVSFRIGFDSVEAAKICLSLVESVCFIVLAKKQSGKTNTLTALGVTGKS
jgi:hypothetical protein